ncbi:MAG: PHP domain-containing protein [Dehalococcoidia bacterium]
MLIDLHTHTHRYSLDSGLSPDELVEGAKAAGLDGICITEHDQFWDHREVRRLANRHDFLVLAGCEITTEDGHMLVFGLDGYVFGMHRAQFLKKMADRAGAAMLVAHPYRRQFNGERGPWVPPYDDQVVKACANAVFHIADAVETLNGRGTSEQNGFSLDICTRHGMPAIGASDSHEVNDIGTCATEFERPIGGLEDLVAELKAGKYRPVELRRSP